MIAYCKKCRDKKDIKNPRTISDSDRRKITQEEFDKLYKEFSKRNH